MCPVSAEVSFTTAVYFTCSMSAVRVWKSCGDLSIIPSTPSMLQRSFVCASTAGSSPAEQQKAPSTNKRIQRFKRGLHRRKISCIQRLEILAYIEGCENLPHRFLGTEFHRDRGLKLMADFHLVCGHRALIVA